MSGNTYNNLINFYFDKKFPIGRILTLNKRKFFNKNLNHVIIFDANIFIETGVKIWEGDLDLSNDISILQDLYNYIKTEFYVTESIKIPLWNTMDINKIKEIFIIDSSFNINEKYKNFIYRDKNGFYKKNG